MNLKKLLRPRRLCIVGANDKEGFGGDTTRNAIRYMEEGAYYLVNNKRGEVQGKKAYPSIAELPEPIDLVVVCTPAAAVPGILREASAKGAGGAVVYASGYKEVGTAEGEDAQKKLVALCKDLDMAVMGPNCAGFVNYVDGVHAFAFIPFQRDRKGKVGFVSQSGQLCYSMMESPATAFSYLISAGNAAVTTMEDYMDFLVDDTETKVLAVYLEGVKNPVQFANALKKAAELRKPVVVLKAGRSDKGVKLAASHTGSLSGADQVFDALFAKFGVIRVDDLEELIYTAQTLATLPALPKGLGIGSINLSGGETGICADVGSMHSIEYPDLSEKTLASLTAVLPSYATPANPLDATATLSFDTEKYAKALRSMMSEPAVDMVLLGYTMTQEITDPSIKYMAVAIEEVSKDPGAKPMIMMPFTGNTRNPEYLKRLEAAGVPILPPPVYAFKILAHLTKFVSYDYRKVDSRLAIPSKPRGAERFSCNEFEGKQILAKYGIPVGKQEIAKDANGAANIAGRIGFPVVMKIVSADILHKSDIGGVILNIANESAARDAFDRIMDNAKKAKPQARLDGVLVQSMMPPGTEFIIGVNNDPQWGPAVMAGLGGVFVEVFRDTALRLAPLSLDEARGMINSLKGARLLKGYRGKAPLDIDALARAVVDVSLFAAEKKDELIEADINPLIVYERGICAVDAVLVSQTPLLP